MVRMMSTQDVYLDQSAIESHRKVIKDALQHERLMDVVRLSGADVDIMFFGNENYDMIGRMKDSLHVKIDSSNKLNISMNLQVGLVRGQGERDGKSSYHKTTEKKFNIISSRRCKWRLMPKYDTAPGEVYNKYNVSVSRPNSISDAVSSLEQGGETVLQTESIRHLLCDRVSRRDSYVMGCINMYMWLQKCIAAYTMEGVKVKGRRYEVDIMKRERREIQLAIKNKDIAIDVESLDKNSLMVLMISLKGHQSTTISDGINNDIWSMIETEERDFCLLTGSGESRSISIELGLLPPEIALSSIYNVVKRLGVFSDWIKAANICRGLAYSKECFDEMVDSEKNQSFSIDCRADSHYGTIFGPITRSNSSKELEYDVENTNLGSSSAALILEFMVGSFLANNIHYMCESMGFMNTTMYTRNRHGDSELMSSVMSEMGLVGDGEKNKIKDLVMNFNDEQKLGGNSQYFVDALTNYVNESSSRMRYMMWPQVNLLYGKVMSNNSTDVIGEKQEVSSMNAGPMAASPDELERARVWLTMHCFNENENMVVYGSTSVGNKHVVSESPYNIAGTEHMFGVYECTNITIKIIGKLKCRPGHDSRTLDSFWHENTYISTGELCNQGENKDDIIEDISELGEDRRTIKFLENTDEEENKNFMEELKKAKEMKGKYSATKKIDQSVRKTESLKLNAKDRNRSLIEDDKDIIEEEIVSKEDEREDKISKSIEDIKDRFGNDLISATMGSRVEDRSGNSDQYSYETFGKKGNKIKKKIPKRYNVIQNEGKGNCALYAVMDSMAMTGYGEACEKLFADMGVRGDGKWQNSDQIVALGTMLSHDTIVEENEKGQKAIMVYPAKKSVGEMYIRFNDNHYEAMVPSVKGDYIIGADHGNAGVATRDEMIKMVQIEPNIGEVYRRLVMNNGYKATLKYEGNNNRVSVVDETEKEKSGVKHIEGFKPKKSSAKKKRKENTLSLNDGSRNQNVNSLFDNSTRYREVMDGRENV